MPKVKLISGEYHNPRDSERTFAMRGGFSGMGGTRIMVSGNSDMNAHARPRTVLYTVAVQTLTHVVREFIRLRGTGRENDAIREARAKHSKFYPARVVAMRIVD